MQHGTSQYVAPVNTLKSPIYKYQDLLAHHINDMVSCLLRSSHWIFLGEVRQNKQNKQNTRRQKISFYPGNQIKF